MLSEVASDQVFYCSHGWIVTITIALVDRTGPQTAGSLGRIRQPNEANSGDFFDVVPLDGLHTYQQINQDPINVLRQCPWGMILINEDNPRTWFGGNVSVNRRLLLKTHCWLRSRVGALRRQQQSWTSRVTNRMRGEL